MKLVDNIKGFAGKYAPGLLIGGGVVGLGATAYLAYKSAPKVEAVVEDLEEQRGLVEDGTMNRVDTVGVVKDLTVALYQPIFLGALSTSAIVAGAAIQNKRIRALAAALASMSAERLYYTNKYKEQYGEEEYNKFMTPVDKDTRPVVDSKGKVKDKEVQTESNLDQLNGFWYKGSSEYTSDDPYYNQMRVRAIKDHLETLKFQYGTLTLNDVRQAFGMPSTRQGALLGWTSSSDLNIGVQETSLYNEESQMEQPEIYIFWSETPTYLYAEGNSVRDYSPSRKELETKLDDISED